MKTRSEKICQLEARIATLQDQVRLTRVSIALEGDVPEPFARFWRRYAWARCGFWIRYWLGR